MKNIQRIIITTIILASLSISAQEYVAVLEFDGSGMSKIDARNITDRFSAKLQQTRKFRLVERQLLNQILEEQKTQLSGCVADECAVEVGELVGAEYVIAGSVTKTFGLYGISVRLISVETGEIITHIQENDESDVQKFLSQRVRNAALRMAAEGGGTYGQSGGSAVTVSNGEKGSVVFTLNKTGAAVFVDNAYTTQASSQTVSLNLTEGPHEIKFTLAGQKDWAKQLNVLAGETLNYEVTFESGTGSGGVAIDYGIVMVRSEPTGAVAYLDGVELGPTPAQNTKVGIGKHLIRVEKLLYHPYVEEVTIASDRIEQIQANLKPRFGRLVIKSEPTGAVVQLNGQQKGKTPIDLPELVSGDYTIKVSKDLYHDSEEKYTITDGSDNENTVVLHPAFGHLSVKVDPEGADVFVDGTVKGQAPVLLNELPSGPYRLKIAEELYDPFEESIIIGDGKITEKSIVLSPRFGTLNVTGLPKGAKISIDGKTVGTLPLEKYKVGTGLIKLEIEAKNYHKYSESFHVELNGIYPLGVDLRKHIGTVIAITDPPDATIQLDGKVMGNSPQILKQVPVGQHTMLFNHPNFPEVVQEFNLNLDERKELNIKLASIPISINGTVTDIDGNTYKTVKIGNQTWMAENLKVTHYRDGTAISKLTADGGWKSTRSSAYCYYNNKSSYKDTYGVLYNWYAISDSRSIAPDGWHVPTDDEWKELEMYLGMSRSEVDVAGYRGINEGSKLAGNVDLWDSGAIGNDKEFGFSGFTALPGGSRGYSDGFSGVGGSGSFGSATEYNSNYMWYRKLDCNGSNIARFRYSKRGGLAVRLLKD
jgi:uncharacterized protein (TIGR02145 family)